MSEKRHMCVRVLVDGERFRNTHFEVVEAGAYDEARDRIRALEAENAKLYDHVYEVHYCQHDLSEPDASSPTHKDSP